MALIPVTLEGADLAFDPAWLARAEADALFERLRADVPWTMHRIRMFGRLVDSPRLSCWIGDAGAGYTYSGTRFEPQPWPPALADLRARVAETCGEEFNSVLANLYRDGRDAMGWHRDDEPELGARPVIASLSLGATRRFVLKEAVAAGSGAVPSKLALELGHGSLLCMAGDTQRHYRHALPRTARAVGPRINLTFRRIRSAP
ncbi:alpha-ketoglutarate-dependent dioxygenase AlkB [Luteimonas sp. MC1572]|uniref:alpha-ketoglutarate-dependent dioxygenase AlkB family protein n=1 Tax=Luteimonas sp. MC1572 TaxID=2799325 RepID=UPI0018F0D311|nr:alpha-ketoglutarate-dependent dioxygenase AlkB [Luteimonas sp. MC1572]MBJ6982379.1 alpha-ketoglutarate-dependent dioxygenase AlkB [Luteimonas sp. MC1572]QQO04473.1 alpha-ketoglutarate-dependent dioxygenase AlkB [Luteimonas sp. MC1572]